MTETEIRKRFADCMSEESLNKEWKQVVFAVHPDRGGNDDMFRTASELYKKRKEQLAQEAEAARVRNDKMKTLGVVGRILTGFSEGKDVTNDLMELVPDKYKGEATILASILNGTK